MDTVTQEKPSQTAQHCQCETQIGEILARLEKLEREALTVEKLKNLEPSKFSEMVLDSLHPSR